MFVELVGREAPGGTAREPVKQGVVMAARDGDAYLRGLKGTSREIWLGDELIEDVV